MAFIILIFLTAIVISSVAAYFSIVGLGALFAATFWGVVVMAAALEVGKIVTTKWVHYNWSRNSSSKIFKSFLCMCIISLMMVTSLGIYGYLSKGHLEQSAPKAGIDLQITQLETQITQREEENSRLQNRLDQINRITDKTLESSARQGLRASERQKAEAKQLQAEIDSNYEEINDLQSKLVPLKMQNSEVEAKLGPVKYVAELFGWEDPEVAVRMIIVLIMIAFDPLAICLFIAGSISLEDWRKERQKREENDQIHPVDPELMERLNSLEDEKISLEEAKSQFEIEKAQLLDDVNSQINKLAADRENLESRHSTIAAKQEELETREKDLEEKVAKVERSLSDIEAEKQSLRDQQALIIETAEELEKQQKELESAKINNVEDKRSNKRKILDMLEGNPEVLQEIIEVIGTYQTSFNDDPSQEKTRN